MKRVLAKAAARLLGRLDIWLETRGTPPYGGPKPPADVCGFWRDNKWCGKPAAAWFRDEREPSNGMCAEHEKEWHEGVAMTERILSGN